MNRIHLNIDLSFQQIVDAVKKGGTVRAVREAGFKGKVMIGGGQIDEQIREYTGADAFGKDAMTAVSLSKAWVGA